MNFPPLKSCTSWEVSNYCFVMGIEIPTNCSIGGIASVMVLAYTAVYLSRHTRTVSEIPSTTPISLKESPMLSKLMRFALVVETSDKSSNPKNETNDVGEINYSSWETFNEDDSSTASVTEGTTESSDLGNVSLSDIVCSEKRRLKVKEVIFFSEKQKNIFRSAICF